MARSSCAWQSAPLPRRRKELLSLPVPGRCADPSIVPAPILCAPRQTETQQSGVNVVLPPMRHDCFSGIRELALTAHAVRAM